jgi:hypothetical protein
VAFFASPVRSLLPGILGAAFTRPLSLLARNGAEGGLRELASAEINVESLVGSSEFDSAGGGSVIAFEGESSLEAKLSFPLLIGPEFSASMLSGSSTGELASSTGGCLTCVGDGVTCSRAI